MEATARLLVISALTLASAPCAATLQRQPGVGIPFAVLSDSAHERAFAGVRAVSAQMRAAPPKLLHAQPPTHALPAGAPTPPLAQVQTGGTRINLDGMRQGSGAAGVSGAAGEQQYVQLAGGRMAVYRKHDGALQYGPVGTHALFDRAPCATPHAGTGSVHYDARARRWIVAHLAHAAGQSVLCIAVSASADAGASYYRYALPMRGAVRADDARMALWRDTVLATFTLFGRDGGNYLGPRACAIDRAALLRGANAHVQCADPGPSYGPLVAATLAGATPPKGTPALFVSLDFTDDGSGQRLLLWRAAASGAPLAIPVAPFAIACGDACIAQPSGGGALAAAGDRLAPQALYREGALLLTHAVQLPDGRTGQRWYELRALPDAPRVYQQGTHAPDALHRAAGSIGVDKMGNIALGYSVAAADTPPGVRYTGRVRSDPPGRMQAEEVIVNGHGVQAVPARAWAASGALTLDPVDGCTFWYTQQYLPLSGPANWRSRIASFAFRNCVQADEQLP